MAKKLGLKEDMRVLILNSPNHYWDLIGELPAGIEIVDGEEENHIDLIHVFVNSKEVYLNCITKWRDQIKPSGMIWVSWPKKSSKVETDINEDHIRTIALENRLVDKSMRC